MANGEHILHEGLGRSETPLPLALFREPIPFLSPTIPQSSGIRWRGFQAILSEGEKSKQIRRGQDPCDCD